MRPTDAYLTEASIHGGDDGISWSAQGAEAALDSTATIPVEPADWLSGLPMLASPWARALGERTQPPAPVLARPERRRRGGRHRR